MCFFISAIKGHPNFAAIIHPTTFPTALKNGLEFETDPPLVSTCRKIYGSVFWAAAKPFQKILKFYFIGSGFGTAVERMPLDLEVLRSLCIGFYSFNHHSNVMTDLSVE